MVKKIHRDMAKRLVRKAIEDYREKFIRTEDLLNGNDRMAIIEEIDSILTDLKADDRARIIAERDMYKKRVKDLEDTLHRWCSEERDEEFEL